MYRVKSNALWHSLPGVVAAYQPIAAPNPFAARQNVMMDGTSTYQLTVVNALPAWSGANGFTFNSAAQDALSTGFIVPSGTNYTFAVQVYKSSAWVAWLSIFGTYGNSYQALGISPGYNGSSLGYIYGATTSGNIISPVLPVGAHHLAMSGYTGWRDGKQEATISGFGYTSINLPMWLGGANNASAPYFASGTIRAFAMYRRRLAVGEMTEVARQMAYCHLNPDWSAWGRRRRYYYAPSASFQAAWAARRNTLLGGGM